MSRHWHRAETVTERPYTNCVGMSCNASSHNGITLLEQCECEQARSINLHKRTSWKGTTIEDREFGSWTKKKNSYVNNWEIKKEEEEQDWVCIECDEYRKNDPKVKIGIKCMICTYDYKGGE